METVNELFKALGGTSAVARAIGKRQSTASEMKRRRSINPKYWPAILQAAKVIGQNITEADLLRIHIYDGDLMAIPEKLPK